MANIVFNVFYNCVLTFIILYGCIQLYMEAIFSIFPLSIFCSGILFVLIYFLRVPPIEQTIIEEVVGKDPSIEIIDNNNPWIMRTVAHRGAGLDAPENSLPAFKLCSEKGCDTIEFDVQLTYDHVPVIFHDDTLERMTNSDAIVEKLTWEELKAFDISVKHSFRDRFENTHIPTLTEVVLQCLACRQRMIIDIKTKNKKIVKVILDLFDQHPELLSRAVVSSFYAHIIYLVRRGNPKIVCSLAWRPYFFSTMHYHSLTNAMPPRYKVWYKNLAAQMMDILYEWSLTKFVYYLLGISLILLHKDVVSGRSILQWRNKGVRVIAWTVNHPVEKQYFSRILKITYLTDTLTGEGTAHLNQSH